MVSRVLAAVSRGPTIFVIVSQYQGNSFPADNLKVALLTANWQQNRLGGAAGALGRRFLWDSYDASLTTLPASAVAGTMPNHCAASLSVQSSR